MVPIGIPIGIPIGKVIFSRFQISYWNSNRKIGIPTRFRISEAHPFLQEFQWEFGGLFQLERCLEIAWLKS